VASGHEVTATTTGPGKLDMLARLGAEPVVMDGLDAVSVGEAVAKARPDVIVHQMTAIAGKPDLKHMDRWIARTVARSYLSAPKRSRAARRIASRAGSERSVNAMG
jgi:nucleoside-diphosphate-sugar epimerase